MYFFVLAWQADAAIAAEHIQLAATEQGLGACWCHTYGRDESEAMVRRLMNIPDKYNVLCVIALGYKNEERKDYDLDKLLYNKIIQRFYYPCSFFLSFTAPWQETP